MADLFGRRAHASESSYSRERDKEKLARLQEFLRKEGYHIPEKPAAAAYPALPTVDVLAEISAHSLPLGRVRVTQARHSLVHAHLTRARSPHTRALTSHAHLCGERRVHPCSTAHITLTQVHSFVGPAAPDPTLPLPKMPSQSAVIGRSITLTLPYP